MPEDSVIRMDDNVKNDNSPDSEEPPRLKAGFDFAADPNEALFFAPQVYIALGIMGFICLFTIIVIACGGIYYSSGCFIFAILFATIIFVPEPMGHWIHWIVQCIFWICIPLALLGHFIQVVSANQFLLMAKFWAAYKENGESYYNAYITWTYVNTWVLMFPSLINAALVLRMTIFAFQNRGG